MADRSMNTGWQLLKPLLEENKNTEYGRKYHFSDVNSIDDYKKMVPLSTFDDYENYVERMKAGEKDILTSYELLTFCTTSGTSKKRIKYIPQTKKQHEIYADHLDSYPDRFIREHGGKRFYQQTFCTEPGIRQENMLISEQWYKFKAESGLMKFSDYVGGKDLLFSRCPHDLIFARCYAALLEKDIRTIEALYLYDVYHFFTYMEHYFDELLRAIRTRTIPERFVKDAGVRKMLTELPVSEGRIRGIEEAAREGFEGIAKRLWPTVQLLTGISNRSYFAESDGLDYYAGGIPRYYKIYALSEMYVANSVGLNDYRYRIFMEHGFYEFLPCEDESGEETVTADECIIGKEYELIITSFNGFYRYRTGDVLKIDSFDEGAPVVEFVRRRGMAMNIAGEKINMLQLEESVRRLGEDGLVIGQFCFAPSLNRNSIRYCVALSVAEEPSMSDDEIAEHLDEHLKEINSGYAWIRNMDMMACPAVKTFLPEKYFQFLKKNGMMDGNIKPKHTAPMGFPEW